MANGKITKEQREAIEELRGYLPSIAKRTLTRRIIRGVHSVTNMVPGTSKLSFASVYNCIRRYDARQKKAQQTATAGV